MLDHVYSELCRAPVELSHWSFDKGGPRGRLIWSPAVTKPGPFVLNTNLRLQLTADHPSRGTALWPGLVRSTDEPHAAPL